MSVESLPVKMYTRKICPYCVHAKNLLTQLGVEFEEISVEGDPDTLQKMMELSGRRTVPQIWIGETHVGGYDDLASLHRSGQLQPLLERVLGKS